MSWNDVRTPCIFCVLLDKTKICKLWEWWRVTCHKYFGPKTRFFLVHTLRDHYAVIFTGLLHKINLLFLRFEFAQESKKFQKMDIDDVQKSICRNLFVKIDAALGVLRNFLGPLFGRPYMQGEYTCMIIKKMSVRVSIHSRKNWIVCVKC
jgi:hypothetical protein